MYVKTTFMFKEDKGRRGRRKKNFGDAAARGLFCNLSNNLFGRKSQFYSISELRVRGDRHTHYTLRHWISEKLIHGSFIKVPSS